MNQKIFWPATAELVMKGLILLLTYSYCAICWFIYTFIFFPLSKEVEDIQWKHGKSDRIPARDVRYEDPPDEPEKDDNWHGSADTPLRDNSGRITPAKYSHAQDSMSSRDSWREKGSRDVDRGDRDR